MTLDEPGSAPGNDDAALWLAACDERLAAGEPIASLEEVGVPAALRPRLEVEAAWCQLVRRIWPHSTEPELSPSNLWSEDEARLSEEHPTELGRFVIRRELGRGSFGIVYLAYDPRLRRELALKVPRGEVLLSSELRARFRNEAMAAAGLDHPNIVAVYEAGEEGPCCFIASAYCPGITLAAWLRAAHQGRAAPHGREAGRHTGRGRRACTPPRRSAPRPQAEQRLARDARRSGRGSSRRRRLERPGSPRHRLRAGQASR